MEQKTETKKSFIPVILVLLLILILVGIGYWWTKKRVVSPVPTLPPAEEVVPKEDSVIAINQDLEGIEILNLEREFQEIDQDLNSL